MQASDGPASAGDSPDALLAAVDEMVALARDGEWLRVEHLAATLEARIRGLAAGSRRDELAAAYAGIERLSVLALSARSDVGDKLKAIRHGRKATASYRTTGAR